MLGNNINKEIGYDVVLKRLQDKEMEMIELLVLYEKALREIERLEEFEKEVYEWRRREASECEKEVVAEEWEYRE